MFDRNAAIEAYSESAGNRIDRLEAYCRATGFSEDIAVLAASISRIQQEVFDEIWNRSESRPLTQDEMVAITREYVARREPWINEKGIMGLLQWIAYMSWHEGCVKFPEPPRKAKPWWQFW